MKFLLLLVVVGIIISLIYICYVWGITPHQILNPQCYGIIYPEGEIDLRPLRTEKIIISIASFNCDISKLRERVNYLVQGFKDYRIFIYGLDSTRVESLQGLYTWKVLDPDHLFLVPPRDLTGLKRIERIGTIRNAILDDIQTRHLGDEWKLMVMDSDYKGTMSKMGLIEALQRLDSNEKLYAVCASGTVDLGLGISLVYDHFAYRDLEDRMFSFLPYFYLQNFNPIHSGFSGAVLYRYADLRKNRYPIGTEECEHVTLHHLLAQIYESRFEERCHMEMIKRWHIYVGLQPHNW